MKNFEAVILSGGKGTRIKKYTKIIPKCLVDINGKPFLYHQLKYLKRYKIKKVIISTGYLSNQVEEYLNNNIKFIKFKIMPDGRKPLGTGGAILKTLPYLKKNFFIIYGDSYLRFNLQDLKKGTNRFAKMAVFKNLGNYDKSNIEIKASKNIAYYSNKLNKKKLLYIDYGISWVNKKIFKYMKPNKKFDLSELFEKISIKNMLKGHIIKKRFYEIGSYNGIKELKKKKKKK